MILLGEAEREAHCSAMASITRKHPSSEIAATYFTSGEKTKSGGCQRPFERPIAEISPTTLRLETLQWLTGFLADLSLSDFPAPFATETGCHGGKVTNMLSSGFHSPCDEFDNDPLPFSGVDTEGDGWVGSWGTKAPSSRSLSYTMTVPSA